MLPQFFIGEPISFKNLVKIYPPKVSDILTNPYFGQYLSVLTTSQEDIWDLMEKKEAEQIPTGPPDPNKSPSRAPTPFEMILINAYHNPLMQTTILKAFEFFTHEQIRILPEEKLIVFVSDIDEVKQVEDLRILKEEDYFEFQNMIRASMGEDPIEAPVEDEDPRVARIKAKARERERIKKKQGSKNGISLTTTMASLCCMGIGITPLNIGEISYASVSVLMKTYQEKEKYGIDTQFLAGGADPKKLKPKYWIRNLKD